MKKKCKDCKIRYFPTCYDCKDWFAPNWCDGCGVFVCGGNMHFIKVSAKTVREKFFVKDCRNSYKICHKCYKEKYLGEENGETKL